MNKILFQEEKMENEKRVLELLKNATKQEINALFEVAVTRYESRNLAEAALLLGADVTDNIFCVNNIELLEFLCSKATKAQFESTKAGEALCLACRRNNVEKVKLLLDYGVDPNQAHFGIVGQGETWTNISQEDDNSRTPLEAAIYQNNQEIVKLLIEAGNNVKSYHLSMSARFNASEKIMELLIDSLDGLGMNSLGLTDPVNGTFWVICNRGYISALLKVFGKLKLEEVEKQVHLCVDWAIHINCSIAADKIIDVMITQYSDFLTEEEHQAIEKFKKHRKELELWNEMRKKVEIKSSSSHQLARRKFRSDGHITS